LKFLLTESVDLLFLDIQMPGMNGFELLAKLTTQPAIVFTTAYNQYALRAFEVNSIAYLLKPVDPLQLERAIKKLELFRDSGNSLELRANFQTLMKQLAEGFSGAPTESAHRICSRVGDRMIFIELDQITHFFSEDKLTYGATETKNYVVDHTISELEQKLASKGFARIHRGTLVNLRFVNELHRWFSGRMRVRMKDKNRTELTVSRDRVRSLQERLNLH
jgi:two-component system LytT family response regulator